MIEHAYWPWWLGGLCLGGVSLLHLVWTGRLLSVSGIVSRIMRWSADEKDRESELALERGDLDDALMAATLAQFGDQLPEELRSEVTDETSGVCSASNSVRIPVSSGAVFLVSLMLGGSLSASWVGGFDLTWSLGPSFERFFTNGTLQVVASVLGGFFVGFGARMAGGCTSSHGLAGCARLDSGSLLATISFFAGGVSVSMALRGIVS